MKRDRLLDALQRNAHRMRRGRPSHRDQAGILDAYLAGEKVEAIGAEFGVCASYPVMLAKRRGFTVRSVGRPAR